MNIFLFVLLVLNLIVSCYVLYNTYKADATKQQAKSDTDQLEKRISSFQNTQSEIETKIKSMVNVTKQNNEEIQKEFDSYDDQINDIIARMEAVERGIARIDRDEKDIRSYYMNYVSRVGYEEATNA